MLFLVVLGPLLLTAVWVQGLLRRSPGDEAATNTDVELKVDSLSGPAAAPPALEGPEYDTNVISSPTGEQPVSQTWFHDGTWWGVLHDKQSGDFHIWALDWATQAWADTGVLVDDREFVRPDVMWDGSHLYVVASGTRDYRSHGLRLTRYGYDRDARRYQVDANFPVGLTNGGVGHTVITKDTNGVLWVSYLQNGRVTVNHNTSSEAIWGQAYVVPGPAQELTADDQVIQRFDTRVAIAWTNASRDSLFVSTHEAGAADDAWTTSEHEFRGLADKANHLSTKAIGTGDEARLLVVAETGLNETGSNENDPRVVLFDVRPDGASTSYLVAEVGDKVTRPTLLIDREAGQVVVVATSPPNGGLITMKEAPLDTLEFKAGAGERLIAGLFFSDFATSTKQTLSAATGLLVLASDDQHGRYLHGARSLGGPPPGTQVAGPTRPAPHRAERTVLAHETFDPRPAGSPPAADWSERGVEGTPPARVVPLPSADNHSLELVSNAAGEDLQLCRAISETSSGRLLVEVDVWVDGVIDSDALITSVRGDGETASVRFTRKGSLGFVFGPRRAETKLYLERNWYRSAVTVDFETKTYDWQLQEPSGTSIVALQGMAWRAPDATSVDEVCFSTSSGRQGLRLLIDNVRVTR